MEPGPILVVDDEPDMRLAVTHALRSGGYSVETASSGPEALDKFRNDRFSAVITDVKMPEMNGMELLDGLKRISSSIPVIMMTAYGSVCNAVEAMKEGASDYIVKPFTSEALRTAVGRAVIRPDNTSHGDPEGRNVDDSVAKRIITQDPEMQKTLALARNVARSNATILILGESGTGKEMLASYIHQNSERREGPYVAVNCAALPESLAESELFGHEKGAFTGAVGRKPGRFELAHQGTLLLDEISEMPMPLQAKLLRVLQEREIDRVGGSRPVPIDLRIIAVSNRDLKEAVREGKFREDLFYRINVIPLTLPPLRDREGDIKPLSECFLKKYASRNGKEINRIGDEAMATLLRHDWKGNVRELENTIERAVLMADCDEILSSHLFLDCEEGNSKGQVPVRVGLSVKEMEKELIFRTLDKVEDNRTHAAEMLGISIRTLRNKLREYRESTT